MAQNSSFLNEIDREATKVRANTHLQKSLPGIGISLKTTGTFIRIFWELYSVVLKAICKEFTFPVSKIFEVLRPLRYASYSARPIRSNYGSPSMEARVNIPRVTLEKFKRRYILGLRYNIILGFSNVAMWFNSIFTHAHYIE